MVLAEDLRQAVLQAALQGKLTEQLETDSDVNEMLISIQEEKEKFVADKKIQKGKPLSKILDEDFPFEIPDNWKFVQLGEIALYLDAGKSPDCIKESVIGDEWGVITTTAIQANKFCESENKRLPNDFAINKDIKIEPNDILITRAGPMTRTGIMCLVENIKFNLLLSDKTVRVNIDNKNIIKKYIVNAINSPCIRLQIINMMSGMDKQQVNISQEKIRRIIIPIPPSEEQQRIVDKINEIMPKIDEYEKIEKELRALKKEFPINMKDALLQAAMQGKLTEQLENDSSVDELLEAIKKEKEELIAQKKIKKEKSLPDIDEVEIPFDIPDNWRWEKVGNICDCGAGATPIRSDRRFYEDGSIFWLKTGELTDGYIFHCEEKITQLALEKCSLRLNKEGDILIAMYGATIGKLGIVTFPLTTNQACCGCSPYKGVYNLYLFYYLMFAKKMLISKAEGGAQPNISREKIRNSLIPLPPIEEQQRIVERLDALLPLCEDLIGK